MPETGTEEFCGVQQWFTGTPLEPLAPAFDKWFNGNLERAYAPVRDSQTDFFDRLLSTLKIQYECTAADLRRIPSKGAAIVVANHPMGLADGVILGSLMQRVRADFRFLANSILMGVPQLRAHVIPVNPFGGSEATLYNRAGLRRAMEWLRDGGLLVVFPAGEVASMRLPGLAIEEPEWNENEVRLIQRMKAPAVPVFIHGGNSVAFHAAGLVNPGLRTLMLPSELLNKSGSNIRISIGNPVPPARLALIANPAAAAHYLRARTCLLGTRQSKAPARLSSTQEPLANEQTPEITAREMEMLPASQRLVTHGEYTVFYAAAAQIPSALNEIGRLRELTFRRAGEGAGRARDLDRFDPDYDHLILWQSRKREIAGAYRMAKTDNVIQRRGVRGLYTSTLFHLRRDFYSRIGPALELGRSFVRPEYQKEYLPLLLLWKGLGHYVAAFPRYKILFGPVSISRDYNASSRALMVNYLRSRHGDLALSDCVRPRKTFRVRRPNGFDARNFASLISDLDELSGAVADLESDQKGIPILLQQYLQMGGRILEFSVDRKFSNVLDGLVVVDLAAAKRRQLDRYMGRENAERFLALTDQ